MQHTIKHLKITLLALLSLACLLSIQSAQAQLFGSSDKQADQTAAVDPLGRTSPRGTVEGYLKAIRDSDFGKAARYLDVTNHPLPKRKKIGVERAKELIQLLDRNGDVHEISDLSQNLDGDIGDHINASVETVGVLDRQTRNIPLLLHRVKGEGELQIWLFEPETLNSVPFLLQISHETLLDRILPESLKADKIGQVSIGHWIAIGLSAVVAVVIGLLLSWVLMWALRKLPTRQRSVPGMNLLSSITLPFGVLVGVSLYRIAVNWLGVQLVARDAINWIATVAFLLALAWLGMRLVDGLAEISRYGMSRTKKLNSVAVVMLARRVGKAVILGAVCIAVLDIFGFDVSTGLAALGIGGIALALGSQRTIENLVGSITVVADRPVSVGDFCKFGDVMGTVEDIGIRSSQVRTLDRTIVTIPNGVFASMEIENYSRRDEFRLYTVLTMRYETTPAQVRYLLVELRKLLADTESVTEAPARVRFVGLGSHSIDIEIFAYAAVADYSEFLEVQEEFLLEIMEIVSRSGTDFAFPSQTLYFGKDHPPSHERANEIEAIVGAMADLSTAKAEPKPTPKKTSTRKRK